MTDTGGDGSEYKYNKWEAIELWPAVLCAVLFLIVSVINLGLTIKTKTRFMYWAAFSGFSEAAGYAARAWVSKYPETDAITAMQCFLIITPIFLALVQYVVIGHLLVLAPDQDRARLLGCIPPHWVARLFFVSDVICIAVQGVGAAFLLNNSNPDGVEVGRYIMIVGLVLQLFFFTLFTLITLWVLFKKDLGITQRLGPRTTHKVFFSLCATVTLLYLRTCFRVAEFAQPEGFDSDLATQEKWTYGLDFVPIYLVMIIFTALHFGFYLSPDHINHIKQYNQHKTRQDPATETTAMTSMRVDSGLASSGTTVLSKLVPPPPAAACRAIITRRLREHNFYWIGLSRNPAITFQIVKDTDVRQWYWAELSRNPGITFEDVRANPDMPWDWHALSRNPSITFDDVRANPNMPWCWNGLSRNPGITFEDVRANPHREWAWFKLSCNPGITFQAVNDNPDRPWDWYELSQNPSITFQNVKDNLDMPWEWYFLSENPGITFEDVRDNPDMPWCFNQLSCNPGITFQIVKDNPGVPWNWNLLSCHPAITFADVRAHPDMPWNWSELSRKPGIIFDDVMANPDRPWDWAELSRNPSITFEDVRANPDKLWDWDELSSNPNITFQIVKDNPDRPWNWDSLSRNPSITFDDVKDNPEMPWDWSVLSENPNIFMPTARELEAYVREHMAVRSI